MKTILLTISITASTAGWLCVLLSRPVNASTQNAEQKPTERFNDVQSLRRRRRMTEGELWELTGQVLQEEGQTKYGASVALSASGHRLAVGVPGCTEANECVRVFDLKRSTDGERSMWVQAGVIGGRKGHANELAGGATVCLSSNGNLLAVGYPKNDEVAREAGKVQVYKWNARTARWKTHGSPIYGEDARDKIGGGVDGNDFAYDTTFGLSLPAIPITSVSLSPNGKILALGSYAHDGGMGQEQGQVRIFRFSSSDKDWTMVGEELLGDDDPFGTSWLGYSVSLSKRGQCIVVGEPMAHKRPDPWYGGQARVYQLVSTKTGDHWRRMGPFINRSGEDLDGDYLFFGSAVAMSDDCKCLAIGMPRIESGEEAVTRVYRFDEGDEAWEQVGPDILTKRNEFPDGAFAISLALSKGCRRIAVGYPLANLDDERTRSGFVVVYQLENSVDGEGYDWSPVGERLTGTNRLDLFGYSVDMSDDGSVLAVGAPLVGSEDGIQQSGKVFVYELD